MAGTRNFVDFSKGINNIAQLDALPEGSARQIVNLDPVVGNGLAMRAGYQLQEAVANIRGGVAVQGDLIVVADKIRRFSPRTGFSVELADAPDGDLIIGTELNGDCFLQVGVTQLRIRGNTVGPWALDEISPAVTFVAGTLPAGVYRIAVTAIDQFGAESGATPYIVSLNGAQNVGLTWNVPEGAVSCRVYASAANGETLYMQSEATSSFTLSYVRDDLARMTTMNMQLPPLGSQISTYKARVLVASNNVLWMTEPSAPHLTDFISGHISYDDDIQMVAPVDGGVFVATSKRTYFVGNMGLDQQGQVTLAEFGAIAGSQLLLPDGRATWLTEYGQAFGDKSGTLDMPQRPSYAPNITSSASAGLVSHNGVQMIVNNLAGAITPNSLSVVDSFDLEIE